MFASPWYFNIIFCDSVYFSRYTRQQQQLCTAEMGMETKRKRDSAGRIIKNKKQLENPSLWNWFLLFLFLIFVLIVCELNLKRNEKKEKTWREEWKGIHCWCPNMSEAKLCTVRKYLVGLHYTNMMIMSKVMRELGGWKDSMTSWSIIKVL